MGFCCSREGKTEAEKLQDLENERAARIRAMIYLEETDEFAQFLEGLKNIKSSNPEVSVHLVT
jgi:hypothetical protein